MCNRKVLKQSIAVMCLRWRRRRRHRWSGKQVPTDWAAGEGGRLYGVRGRPGRAAKSN